MTADLPRPVEVTQAWDLGDTEPRDVETCVEWGVRWELSTGNSGVDPCASRAAAERLAATYRRTAGDPGTRVTLVSRTVHVGPWTEVAS